MRRWENGPLVGFVGGAGLLGIMYAWLLFLIALVVRVG